LASNRNFAVRRLSSGAASHQEKLIMTPDEDAAIWQEAEAWRARARELADWATWNLVNRIDIYGCQYIGDSGEFERTTKHDGLTWERLVRHFTAATTYDVIGLHNTAPNETCRWVAVDIDAHDGQSASPEANLRFALEVRQRASLAGLAVRLCDTSGNRGGYHLWMPFDRPIPMADARRLVLWLARDWDAFGLRRHPDLFPRNHRLTLKRCGHWLRLPGRHHKRDSWTTVWSPKRETWRSGDEAVDALLSLRGKPVDVAAIVPAEFVDLSFTPSSNAPRAKVVVAPGANVAATSPTNATPRGVSPSSPKRHGRAGCGPRDLGLARAALEFYKNDDLHYDLWLEIGMALRNLADEAAAFQLWDDWSATSGKYVQDVTAATWDSIRPADESGGIGLGTLYYRAMESGWAGPAFLTLRDGHGRKGANRRSGRRGTIVVACKAVTAHGKPADNSPSAPSPGELNSRPVRPSDPPSE
jgi:Primase C terminal 2 (PriCT-2)